jgi:hypothetical protein
MGAASLELMQLLQMVVAPGGVADIGGQHYNFKTGSIDRETRGCNPGCPYSERLVAEGEDAFFSPLGEHPAAEAEREARRRGQLQLRRDSKRAAASRPGVLRQLQARLRRHMHFVQRRAGA